MRPAHRAFFGFTIFVGLILAAFTLTASFERYGPILWIPVGGAGSGAIFAWARYSQFRRGTKQAGEAVLEFFGGMMIRRFDERRVVSMPMQSLVLSRAENRCQFPGCKEKRRSHLDIHHIDDGAPSRFAADNLIAVCVDHHWEIHRRQDITTQQVQGWAMGKQRPDVS